MLIERLYAFLAMLDLLQRFSPVPVDLLPHLGRLRYQLDRNLEAARPQPAARTLEQLPYCLGAAAHALFELSRLQCEVVERVVRALPPYTITIASPHERNMLGYTVDAFLDAARRTQNSVIPYVSRKLSLSLPQSLSDLVKKIQGSKITLPETVGSPVLAYWEKHGNSLKVYRDLSQHSAIVASEVWVHVPLEGSPGISMLLANNPEAKNSKDLRFEDPEIDTLSFIREHFCALLAFCHEITSALLDRHDRRGLIEIGVLSPLRVGARATKFHRPLEPSQVMGEVNELLRQLKEYDDGGGGRI